MKRCVATRCLVALCVIIMIVLFLIANGVIVLDHSAHRRGEGVFWQGHLYVPCSGVYSEGRTVAKTEDGWRINEVKEDSSHTFIVLRSFLDQSLLVREDYQIPTDGAITSAVWGSRAISDEKVLSLLTKMIREASPDYHYETDGIFQISDGQHMRALCVAFEGCPVATVYLGYMGTIGDNWYITTEISTDRYNEDGSPKLYSVWCYTIPKEYVVTLASYLN